MGRHVHPGAGSNRHRVFAEFELGLSADDLKEGRHGGGVFREFLSGVETEQHEPDVVILEENPAESSILRYDQLRRQVGDCGGWLNIVHPVRLGHGDPGSAAGAPPSPARLVCCHYAQ